MDRRRLIDECGQTAERIMAACGEPSRVEAWSATARLLRARMPLVPSRRSGRTQRTFISAHDGIDQVKRFARKLQE
jgi:hypothetical protein